VASYWASQPKTRAVLGRADQTRNPDRYARLLKLTETFLDMPVRNGHAVAQANVFRPGSDDESFDETPILSKITE